MTLVAPRCYPASRVLASAARSTILIGVAHWMPFALSAERVRRCLGIGALLASLGSSRHQVAARSRDLGFVVKPLEVGVHRKAGLF